MLHSCLLAFPQFDTNIKDSSPSSETRKSFKGRTNPPTRDSHSEHEQKGERPASREIVSATGRDKVGSSEADCQGAMTKLEASTREAETDGDGGRVLSMPIDLSLCSKENAHRSSLKWGVSQMLSTQLSHYLQPGADSPEVRKTF